MGNFSIEALLSEVELDHKSRVMLNGLWPQSGKFNLAKLLARSSCYNFQTAITDK